MEFDDHSNHVIELHETVSREDRLINFNSFRRKVGIKRFVLCFLRALRVLRGGLVVGRLAIGHEIATESLRKWESRILRVVRWSNALILTVCRQRLQTAPEV